MVGPAGTGRSHLVVGRREAHLRVRRPLERWRQAAVLDHGRSRLSLPIARPGDVTLGLPWEEARRCWRARAPRPRWGGHSCYARAPHPLRGGRSRHAGVAAAAAPAPLPALGRQGR
jgi:hypothetical protein